MEATLPEAILTLSRRLQYLEEQDHNLRSEKALSWDLKEAAALRLAIRELERRKAFDPVKAMVELCDELDRMNLGYGIETSLMWRKVAMCRVVADQFRR